jgi:hypothetical protein
VVRTAYRPARIGRAPNWAHAGGGMVTHGQGGSSLVADGSSPNRLEVQAEIPGEDEQSNQDDVGWRELVVRYRP